MALFCKHEKVFTVYTSIVDFIWIFSRNTLSDKELMPIWNGLNTLCDDDVADPSGIKSTLVWFIDTNKWCGSFKRYFSRLHKNSHIMLINKNFFYTFMAKLTTVNRIKFSAQYSIKFTFISVWFTAHKNA